MNIFKGSWKTTSIGLTMVIGVIVHFVYTCLHGPIQEMDIMTLVGGVFGGIGFMVSRDNDKTSEDVGVKPAGLSVQDAAKLCVMVSMLPLMAGCTSSVSVTKANADTVRAVKATAEQDVPFIAGFISQTWADHETNQANRLFNAALAENSVQASLSPQIPAADGTAPKTVQVVPEPQRSMLQAKHDQDLAQIAVGKQQIYQAVINRFAGNLAAAQALLDGQAAYYKTAGANTSTLQLGLDGVLAAFEKFAPVISTAVAPKKK